MNPSLFFAPHALSPILQPMTQLAWFGLRDAGSTSMPRSQAIYESVADLLHDLENTPLS
jgi:hypothetical protein